MWILTIQLKHLKDKLIESIFIINVQNNIFYILLSFLKVHILFSDIICVDVVDVGSQTALGAADGHQSNLRACSTDCGTRLM